MIDFRSGREPKSSSFDYISIRIAAPEEIRGPRDPKERERLELQGQRPWWSWGEGLGVPLREVQADPLSRRDLRPLRRRGDAQQGPAGAHGPHRAQRAGGA